MDVAGRSLHDLISTSAQPESGVRPRLALVAVGAMTDSMVFLHGTHRPECVATVDKTFDYHTVQLMTRGTVELSYDTNRYRMAGTWLWPCFPGPHIRFREWPIGRSWDHRHLAVTGPRVADWDTAGLWPRTPRQITGSQSEDLAATFDEMIALSRRPERRARRRAANLLERLLLDWADARGAVDEHEPSWQSAVMTALAAPEPPDYEQLAEEANLSLSSLRRTFRAATGSSLHDFRLECRVLEARRQLGTTDDPIKVVAQRLGYLDVFYFTRQFTQRVGMSPAAYRRARQGTTLDAPTSERPPA